MPILLHVLFITSVIPILLAVSAAQCRRRQFGHLDNNHPREQQRQQTGLGARLVAAQYNAWEALIIFLVVTVIVYASGINLHDLAPVSLIFLLARILHALFYAANLGALRSLSYAIGYLCCLYLFYLAVTGFQ